MKKLTVKTLFIMCSLFFLASQSFAADGLNSIHSSDGNFVIAVGKSGNIMRSFNGGVYFSGVVTGSTANFNSVSTYGPKVWIAGDNGVILKSDNQAWAFSSYSAGSSNLYSVYFLNENLGWAVGHNGFIAKTINGGVNWTTQNSTLSTSLRSVKFSSSTNGVACGDNGKVIHTIDGGSTWNQYTTPTTKDLLTVDIKNNVIIATGVDGFIIKYQGGVWSSIDYKIVSKTDVRGISIIDDNTYYTCGGGGFIRKTTNGIHKYQANPVMAPLSSIYFHNANTGWAINSINNAIVRTTNAGDNWSFQTGVNVTYNWELKRTTSGNIGNPFYLHPKNKDAVFILAGRALYKSYDKGNTWILLKDSIPGGDCHGFIVSGTDTNLMIAAKGTSGGRIIKSTNHGQTWFDLFNPINLTSYGIPITADPNEPNTLYLGPDNDTLMKSTDFGVTWTNVGGAETGRKFRSPCSIYIQYENASTIFVGDGTTSMGNGKLWRSSNGGANWSLITTVTGSEVPIVTGTSLDLNLMYHNSWSTGSLWRSTNMGVNFTDMNKPGALWALDLADDDPTAVSYNLYGGTTYLSLTDGASFVETPISNPGSAAGMCYIDKANILAQYSAGIYKLKASYSVVTNVETQLTGVPDKFALSQNYPNPFNPSTKIKYDVPVTGNVSLKIYNTLGMEVANLFQGMKNPGSYEIEFNAQTLASGVYFYKLTSDNFSITKKMMLVK